MASFDPAYNWMMLSEDGPAPYRYKQVPDEPGQDRRDENGKLVLDQNGDKIWDGAFAISGINSKAYPVQFSKIAAIPQDQRGPAVEDFYQTQFWNSWYMRLTSDEVAKRVFDSAVNQGPGTAVKILQGAVNAALGGPKLQVDGGWGPNTLATTNSCEESILVSSFKTQRIAVYNAIAARRQLVGKPVPANVLASWITRANR